MTWLNIQRPDTFSTHRIRQPHEDVLTALYMIAEDLAREGGLVTVSFEREGMTGFKVQRGNVVEPVLEMEVRQSGEGTGWEDCDEEDTQPIEVGEVEA